MDRVERDLKWISVVLLTLGFAMGCVIGILISHLMIIDAMSVFLEGVTIDTVAMTVDINETEIVRTMMEYMPELEQMPVG